MGLYKKNYAHLVELLKARGFLKWAGSGMDGQVQYGPLGALMRQHILRQWWNAMVYNQANVFPVEHSEVLSSTQHSREDGVYTLQRRGSLQSDCLSEYPHVLKLTNGQLPFSIASCGPCRHCSNNQIEQEEKRFFHGMACETQLLLQNYTPPAGSSRVFDYWLQLRLSWWKKFSRHPAHFHAVSSSAINRDHMTNNHSSECTPIQTQLSIVYDFPWGQEPVEEITNYGDRLIRQLPEEEREKCKIGSGKKETLPHCIQCTTSVESGMAAWLVDAYHERLPVGDSKKQSNKPPKLVLQLNSVIAPYQVAVVRIPAAASSPYSQEITHVSDKLSRDLQQAGVSVFNAAHHGGSLVAHCNRNDQLGVLYTVILKADTLNDGVVSIRSRDTELKESMHLSNTVEKLKKYLIADLE